MVTFKKVSEDFYPIQQETKPQILIIPAGIVAELLIILILARIDGLKMLTNENLPHSQYTIGQKYFVCISLSPENGTVCFDVENGSGCQTGISNTQNVM